MNKKLNMIATLLVASGASMPLKAANAERHVFAGPYAGISAGIAHMNTAVKGDHGDSVHNVREYNFSDTNAAGEIGLGWNFKVAPQWVLGLHGTAGLSGIKDEDTAVVQLSTGSQVKTTLKERYNLGVAARIGYQVQPSTLAYLKLGVRFSDFRFTSQDIVKGEARSIQTQTKTRAGFEPGLGVMVKLNNCWSLNAEYSYTFYGSSTMYDTDNSGGNEYPIYKRTPRIGRLMVGLSYHF